MSLDSLPELRVVASDMGKRPGENTAGRMTFEMNIFIGQVNQVHVPLSNRIARYARACLRGK